MGVVEEILSEIEARGCKIALRPPVGRDPEKSSPPVLAVDGARNLTDELRRRIQEHKVEVKLALILKTPPPWLVALANRFALGTTTVITRTNPASGKAEPYAVRVQAENVAAAIAAEVGADSYADVLNDVLCWLDKRSPRATNTKTESYPKP